MISMTKPELHIPKEVYDKVMYWVKKADFEVSGFGTVVYDEKAGAFTVLDACLLEQEGGAAHTDIDATALSRLMYHVHKEKIEGELKWWWHSHVKMPTFWSGTDKSTIEDLGRQGWCVATVFNQMEDMRSAYCTTIQVPVIGSETYFVDELETVVPSYLDGDLVAQWDKEFTANVKKKTYGASLLTGGVGHQSGWENDDYGRIWSNGRWMSREEYTAKWEKDMAKSEGVVIDASIKLTDKPGRTGDPYDLTVDDEARILKMNPIKWVNMLERGDDIELKPYFAKLDNWYKDIGWNGGW